MSIKPSHILGMNGRYRYTKMNPGSARQFGFSKLKTKELMLDQGIPTAQLYHVFDSIDDLEDIQWGSLPTPFVIKPASGSAGKGIVVIISRTQDNQAWQDHDKRVWQERDLALHVTNILDGEYSTWGSNHRAIIEEMIPPHPTLAKYSYQGIADVRVVVFNSVPVMAEVRLPTKESGGRANLDKGAIGLGVDMATGVTTYGIKGKGKYITHFPDSKKKVNGILVPKWKQLLTIATQAANAAGFVFMGADLFIHPEKGPMIVEMNGFPGLSIQLANRSGLKRRLQRVEGLEVRNAQHGVKISQALFAESFADQIRVEEGLTILDYFPKITISGEQGHHTVAPAMVNTGRFRSAISEKLAEELGLVDLDDLLWRQKERIEGKVPVVEVKFRVKNRDITTAMVVTKRLNRTKYKVELGRKDLVGFLIGDDE